MKKIIRGFLIFFIIILLAGSVGSVTKTFAANAAPITNVFQVPDPRFPKNGYSITSGTTVLVWSISKDAAGYDIELIRPGGSRLDKWELGAPTCTATTCSYKMPYKLGTEFGEYQWRVRGKNTSSNSAWSNFATFSYVMLNDIETLNPVKQESIFDSTPEFSWRVVPEGVYRYHLEIYQLDGTVVISMQIRAEDICDAEQCAYTLATPLEVGTYKWRVMGKKWPNTTPWTEMQIFSMVY